MLALDGTGRLTWDDGDVRPLAALLGRHAAKRQSHYNPAIVRYAEHRRLMLSSSLRKMLADEHALRQKLRQVRRATPALRQRRDTGLTPFLHQQQALDYLATAGARSFLLADAPGVGKTAVAIEWASSRLPASRPQRLLVVTPMKAKEQWAREITRWSALPNQAVTLVRGTKAEQRQAAQASTGWVITHWEALHHAAEGFLAKPWDVVILDEAQWIRNRHASRTATAFRLQAQYRLALSGHPFYNTPDELWSVLHFMAPQTYRSYWHFVDMHLHVQPLPFGGMRIEGLRRPKLLQWELEPLMLRRTKQEAYASLPAITRIPLSVELPPAHRRDYEKLRREFFVALEGAERRLPIPSVLARTTRLRQFLVDPGLLSSSLPSLKYPMIYELLQELDGPPVIFTMFRQAALRLQHYLAQRPRRLALPVLAGGLAEHQSATIQRDFVAGRHPGLIVVTQAGGTALNLGRYGYVIFMDLPWTAADLEQAEGRVDRPEEATGRLVATTSWRLSTVNTYEERLAALLEAKHAMFHETFNRQDLEALFQ